MDVDGVLHRRSSRASAVAALPGRAFFLAILCVIATFLRITGMEITEYLCFPGWQTRLVFLFPYAWYLTRWLLHEKDNYALLGLIASSLEVWGGLQKPIVFSAAICTLFVVWSAKRFVSFRTIAKVAGIGFAAFAGMWIVDATIVDGAVSSQIRMFVLEKGFHEDRGSNLDMSWDEMLVQFTGGRLELWSLAIERLQASPWIGSGFDQTFPTTIGDEDRENENIEVGILCHNGYLDLMLSVGVLGFIPFAAIVYWGMSRMHATSIDPAINLVQTGGNGYLVAIAAFNTGGTSRIFTTCCLLPAFILGIGLRLAADSGATGGFPRSKHRFVPAGRE